MICCPESIIPFSSEAFTSISYGSDLISRYGPYPKVTVMYYNEATQTFEASFTRIELNGSPVNNIFIDHGGIFSGFIRLSA